MIPPSQYPPIRQCSPLEACSQILGGKYKCHLLWTLLRNGSLRYSQLRKLAPCATPRILIKQLKELEVDGLIAREIISKKPLHVAYSLTPEGEKLEPLLLAMLEAGMGLLRRRNSTISKGGD